MSRRPWWYCKTFFESKLNCSNAIHDNISHKCLIAYNKKEGTLILQRSVSFCHDHAKTCLCQFLNALLQKQKWLWPCFELKILFCAVGLQRCVGPPHMPILYYFSILHQHSYFLSIVVQNKLIAFYWSWVSRNCCHMTKRFIFHCIYYRVVLQLQLD